MGGTRTSPCPRLSSALGSSVGSACSTEGRNWGGLGWTAAPVEGLRWALPRHQASAVGAATLVGELWENVNILLAGVFWQRHSVLEILLFVSFPVKWD